MWGRAGHIRPDEYQSVNVTPSFLVSRHPFARVASAYRNKLADRNKSHDGEYFYNTYSKQIIKLARGSWKAGDKEPSFNEFVHYLINTEVRDYDEHWQPIYIRCRCVRVTINIMLVKINHNFNLNCIF